MPVVTPSTYVPILYTKRGERSALSDLAPTVDSAFIPLFVINGVDWDYDKEEPKKTVDDHLDHTIEDLLKKWRGAACFVDAQEVGDELMADGRHPLTWIVETLRARGREATPVTSTDRSAVYQAAVKSLVASGTELCVRLASKDWTEATVHSSDLFSLIALVRATPQTTHLIFDAGLYDQSTTGAFMQMALSNLRIPADWASVTVAASSMPSSMPSGDGLHTISRPEWPEYMRLVSMSLPRTPSFGDYGVQSPDSSAGLDPRLMSPSNNFRYLMDDYWYLPKAGLFRRGGSQPLVPMLMLLRKQPGYVPGASACETWIDGFARNQTVSAGNPETWRRYGTVRHIMRSIELIATLYGPLGSPAPGHAVP